MIPTLHPRNAAERAFLDTLGGILILSLTKELPMCHAKTCKTCGKTTWAGCGQHVDQVMRGVPKSKRCACPPTPSLVERLFGGRKAKV